MDSSEYLTSSQVAQRYGVSLRQVWYAVKRNKLKGVKKFGWQWMFEEAKLPEQFPLRTYCKGDNTHVGGML